MKRYGQRIAAAALMIIAGGGIAFASVGGDLGALTGYTAPTGTGADGRPSYCPPKDCIILLGVQSDCAAIQGARSISPDHPTRVGMSTVDGERDKLRPTYNEQADQISTLDRDVQALSEEIPRLGAEIKALQTELDSVEDQKERGELQAEIEGLQKLLGEAQGTLSSAEAELARWREEFAKTQTSMDGLNTKFQLYEKQADDLARNC